LEKRAEQVVPGSEGGGRGKGGAGDRGEKWPKQYAHMWINEGTSKWERHIYKTKSKSYTQKCERWLSVVVGLHASGTFLWEFLSFQCFYRELRIIVVKVGGLLFFVCCWGEGLWY
jgi:hypothetical protein